METSPLSELAVRRTSEATALSELAVRRTSEAAALSELAVRRTSEAAARTRFPRLVQTAVLATLLVATGALAAGSAAGAPAAVGSELAQCDTDPATPKRQFRAMWIASVANLDWPSRTGLSAAAQRSEFRALLDVAQANRMNAVVVQIRPTADAFWPSPHEPWSQWLTGTQGSSPGYDPLAFMVAQTHARNLEFHAWFNPYRVANHTNPGQLHPSHPARQNPDWVFSYNGQLVYDPGVPAVRQHVTNAMMHAVNNYDIDAVHWDDYFYPYPAGGTPIPDQDTFAEFGGGFSSVQAWRRNNVDQQVQQVSQRIKAAKPWVKFGISPFGIWRNQSTDSRGSATSGLQSYDATFSDTRRWVRQQWIDYVAPQVYWHIGFPVANYAVLVPWWSQVVAGTRVQLYIGQATFRAGDPSQDPAWQDPAELSDHLFLNRDNPQVRGDIHFRAGHVRADRIGAMSRLVADHYSRPALVPVAGHLGGSAPPAPVVTSATRTGSGVALAWRPGGSSNPASYAVYRVDGDGPTDPCAFADARNLVGSVRGQSFTDTTAVPGATYTYHISALHRVHHESGPSAGAVVPGDGGGPFRAVLDATSGRFSASGNWGTSSWNPERFGASYRFAEPVAASDPAWYRFNLPRTGDYRVEVWYPSNPGYHPATPYLVQTTSGTQTVRVDQRSGGGRWVSIGTFRLAGGDRNVVGVSRWTTGSSFVIADAVRITQVS